MAGVYNREKAVEYALKYALSPNPNFYFFGGLGGDCANFISQCLLAGGGKMNFNRTFGWYYVSQNDRAPSWTSAKYLLRFLTENKGIGPFARKVTKSEIGLGDVIFLRQNPDHVNHSLLVTKLENEKIYVCAHTNNARDKPLDEYYFAEAIYIHIEGIRKGDEL